jgi:predicted permease
VILGLEIWSRISRIEPQKLGLYQFLILLGNTAFMGYPVIQAIYGDTGVFYASMFNIWHNVIMFSYALSLLQRGKKIQWGKLLRNNGMIATLLGFVLFLCPFTLPYVLHRPMEWVGDMTIPLCLLIVGGRMSASSPRELLKPRAIWLTSLVRLVLFPLILMPVLMLLGLPEILIVIPVIVFSTPVALTAGALAQEYGGDEEIASRAVVLSNILSIVTMTLVVLALETFVI